MIGGSRHGRGWEFFFSPPRPQRLWGPPSLLSNEYQSLFPWRWSVRGVKLTTHLHLVPRSRMSGAVPAPPNTPPWRGAQLRHRDNFTFTLPLLFVENRMFSFKMLYQIEHFVHITFVMLLYSEQNTTSLSVAREIICSLLLTPSYSFYFFQPWFLFGKCMISHKTYIFNNYYVTAQQCSVLQAFSLNFLNQSQYRNIIKIKVKLSLCLTKHHDMKACWGVEV
jgi:hypothetical protein